jgi:hypothetical protein
MQGFEIFYIARQRNFTDRALIERKFAMKSVVENFDIQI